MAMPLRQKVANRQEDHPGRFIIGLDPVKEKTPAYIKGPSEGIRAALHMMIIVRATHEYAAGYKPNRAYFEALQDGETGLRMLVAYIHTEYSDIPVFLDCKRGDIDRTQHQYGIAHFVLDDVDGMNFSPYMGRDCLEQLVKADKSGNATIITLGRTSNPGAWEIQDAILRNNQRVWEYTLQCAFEWAKGAGIIDRFGVVMGAAHETALLHQYDGTIAAPDYGDRADYDFPIYSYHLKRAREIVGDQVAFLIPGIGKQQGFLAETIRSSYRGPGTMLVSVSSAVDYASTGDDSEKAAEAMAKEVCSEIAEVIATL